MMNDSTPVNPALRILSLEDSRRDFELIQELLLDSGYLPEMERVETEPAFVAALRRTSFDIVLADFNLPEFDAFTALQRTLEICPEVPFLVVSGAVGEETAIDLIKRGAVDYVLKDRPKRLVSAVQRALQEAEQIRLRQAAEVELAEKNRLFRIAGEAARFGGWMVDLAKNICTWSDIVADIHEMPRGYSPSLAAGIGFYAPDWREAITRVFTACAQKGVPYDEEMQILTKTGKRVWVRTIGEAVRDEAGKIVKVQGAFQDITERKQAEDALRDSEERLDLAMAVKNEGIWDWDLTTNQTEYDDRYYTMAGYQPGEFAYHLEEFQKRVHPEDIDRVMQTAEKYLSGELSEYNVEFRFKHKNRSWIWVQGRGKVFEHTESGQPKRFIGTHTDITQRRQAEEALRNSEALFSSSFENAAIGMQLVEPDGHFIKVNKAFCDMVGYSAEEIAELTFEDLTHPDDLERD